MNEAASRIISANDGLQAKKNHIHAECVSEDRALAILIQSAADAPRKAAPPFGGTIMISRRRSDNSLSVFVSPLCSDVEDVMFPLAHAAAILFITDSERRIRPRSDVLSMLFGLTGAEKRIALLLCDGKSLGEISDQQSISTNTLKTHLSRIFMKTGTSRQAQLVKLLLSLPPESSRPEYHPFG
jgi:DNA-binding CsgD family transcriptional regulator